MNTKVTKVTIFLPFIIFKEIINVTPANICPHIHIYARIGYIGKNGNFSNLAKIQ